MLLLVRLLIDYSPANIHFCFTVKGETPYFLASYILKGNVCLFESSRLCFTKEEIGKLLDRLRVRGVSEETADRIWEYTRGWPVAVMSACLALKAEGGRKEFLSVSVHTRVFDYIYYEIFRKLSYDIQCFLADTSCLQSLSPGLCNEVLGRLDSGGILDYLTGENLFLYRFGGPRKRYRYHPVFRDFLQNRQGEERRREILSRAARYCMRTGETEQAVVYAMECQAYSVVRTAVEKLAKSMLEQGRMMTLGQWISYLYPERETTGSLCRYWVYRYFREKGEAETAWKCLAGAMKKCREEGQWQEWGTYGLELTRYAKEQYGMARAAETAEKLEILAQGREDSCCQAIRGKGLEYRLQLGDRKWLVDFFGRTDKKKRRPQLIMERNAVGWALGLEGKKDGWGNTLAEARMYGRVSYVFAQYGFFSYGWFLYLRGDKSYQTVIREGLSIEGDSAYSRQMRMLEILDRCREQEELTEILGDEMRQISRWMEFHGLELPVFAEEDERLLAAMLLGHTNRISGDAVWNPSAMEQERAVLKVLCLGSFSVTAGDRPLVWRTQKTKELFACLFSQEGRGLNKKGLIFWLWPEAEEKKGSTLFDTTVSYLRKSLSQAGAAQVFQVKDHLYTLDMSRIWSDIGRMEEIGEKVRKKRYKDIENPREMAELYRGDYFGSEDYRWLIGKKEYAEQLFLQTARPMALWEMERKDYDTASLLFQKIIEVSGCSPDTLRFLMKCRIQQGDPGAARRQYEKIRRIWEEEWEQELPCDLAEFMKEEEEGEYEGI